jgi:hypothetical protein
MPFAALFSTELAGNLRGDIGYGMHGDMPLELINEGAPAVANTRRVCASNTMHEFGEGHCRYGDFHFPNLSANNSSSSSTVWRFRSAEMIILESRINPRRGDSMACCAR